MAQKPIAVKGGQIRVLVGSGSDPIVYASPCGFIRRALSFNKDLEEVKEPNCENPDEIGWKGRDATALSISVNGEGFMYADAYRVWKALWLSKENFPAKIEERMPDGSMDTWTGYMQIENMDVNAEDSKRVELNISMHSDGEMVYAMVPAGS